ncbi:biotin synthase BioB [Desulfovibrio legallii]|uniref:Biotin synthase n=1 Tax=Desulfovibrio legallii TaxID=571438 RepID=A0A6H3FF08_9BACT|nr:biotin synthase BioB [Desulfovibrio legallii]TBH81875.1 biotin synthase BioB [Desulfovibrio legallii]
MIKSLAVGTPIQALDLLALPLSRLLKQATALREAIFGRRIVLCAIINARSGNCAMDCRFCSQSRHNHTPIDIFPLLPDAELRERILRMAALPVAHIGIVTSGAALSGEEFSRLRACIAALPTAVKPRVCASLGRLAAEQLTDLAAAGLSRYHHNLETSQAYYPHVCTTQTWEQRRETVLRGMRVGFTACTGGLFGLGESWEDRVAFAFSLKKLGVRQVPMNFLHPHPQTPLAGQPPLTAEEALRIVALFRHILPTATLRICGGRPVVLGDRQAEAFAAGANALMTGDYLTTHGQCLESDLNMLARLGLEVDGDGVCAAAS